MGVEPVLHVGLLGPLVQSLHVEQVLLSVSGKKGVGRGVQMEKRKLNKNRKNNTSLGLCPVENSLRVTKTLSKPEWLLCIMEWKLQPESTSAC